MAFRGNYDYQLDDRKRVGIPPRYRDDFAGGAVMTPGVERCIQVFTLDGYDAQAAVLGEVPFETEEGRKFRRAFFGKAFDVKQDTQGRLLIPAQLVVHAGLTKDVVVVGAEKCLEIWSKAAWEAQDEDLTATQLAVLNEIGARKKAQNGQVG